MRLGTRARPRSRRSSSRQLRSYSRELSAHELLTNCPEAADAGALGGRPLPQHPSSGHCVDGMLWKIDKGCVAGVHANRQAESKTGRSSSCRLAGGRRRRSIPTGRSAWSTPSRSRACRPSTSPSVSFRPRLPGDEHGGVHSVDTRRGTDYAFNSVYATRHVGRCDLFDQTDGGAGVE